jgi:hypothetical protein
MGIKEHAILCKFAVAVPDVDHVADTLPFIPIGLLPEPTGLFRPAPEQFDGSIGLVGVVLWHDRLLLSGQGS